MPTYQYACRDCDHRFETVQSIHDDALTECPSCGGSIRRVVGAVGVTFKGSGFYRTDSREAAKKKSPTASSAKTDSASTAKPAASSADSGGSSSASTSGGTSGGASGGASGGSSAGGQAGS